MRSMASRTRNEKKGVQLDGRAGWLVHSCISELDHANHTQPVTFGNHIRAHFERKKRRAPSKKVDPKKRTLF